VRGVLDEVEGSHVLSSQLSLLKACKLHGDSNVNQRVEINVIIYKVANDTYRLRNVSPSTRHWKGAVRAESPSNKQVLSESWNINVGHVDRTASELQTGPTITVRQYNICPPRQPACASISCGS
jgi:hypothetical protein